MNNTIDTWFDLTKQAFELLEAKKLPDLYVDRLKFELEEIDKQGANAYWIGLIKLGKRFKSNPNMLVLPWIFDLVDVDPIAHRNEPMLCTVKASAVRSHNDAHGVIPSDIIKDPDMPDIDLDCLPAARDPIKQYALKTYGLGLNDDGYGPVCSVGTWQTYKFKSAILDVSRALQAVDQNEVFELTTKLPEDVDHLKDGGYATCKNRVLDNNTNIDKECGCIHKYALCPDCGSADTDSPTIGKLLNEFENLAKFNQKYPVVIEYASKLVGRVRNMGMHAGALIIADRSLYGNIPMAKNSGTGYWVSMWTEGRNTQLSKFGYCKWDVLGLKTLEYIYTCCKLIEQNRGIVFGTAKPPGEGPAMDGWDDIDPTQNRAGHYYDGEGKKHYILLNDPHALALANEKKTDAIFQFDTDLAKCCRFDSKVLTDKGYVEIRHLRSGIDKIAFINRDNQLCFTSDFNVVLSGKKPIYDIELEDGRVLHLTADHRVLTTCGYRKVSELTAEDEIVEIDDFDIQTIEK